MFLGAQFYVLLKYLFRFPEQGHYRQLFLEVDYLIKGIFLSDILKLSRVQLALDIPSFKIEF